MSKDILVYIECRDSNLEKVGLELLGEARKLASEDVKVKGVVVGYKLDKVVKTLKEKDVDEIIVLDDVAFAHYSTSAYASAVYDVIKSEDPNIFLIGATSIGRDLAPRISARINTGLTADCTKLDIDENGQLYSTRPAFGGNLFATIICPDHRPQMSTVRPGVMKRASKGACSFEVKEVKVEFEKPQIQVIEEIVEKQTIGKIEDANSLVAVGRGCGCDDSISCARELADLLGGSLATSRSLVDEGKLSQDRQVGQTGKTVRPDLYLAFGISGAVQHLAGMEDSDYIIAVNKDKTASIFNVADLGIVGDGNAILPLVIEEIKNLKK